MLSGINSISTDLDPTHTIMIRVGGNKYTTLSFGSHLLAYCFASWHMGEEQNSRYLYVFRQKRKASTIVWSGVLLQERVL